MKHILTILTITAAIFSGVNYAYAVEVGDIFYNDGTFDKTVRTLDQPAAMTYVSAQSYCNSYVTLGTKKGEWKLPNAMEILRMGNERINGVSNTKFATLNAKLKTLPTGQELLADNWYWIESRGYGVTYLNKYGFGTDAQNRNMYYPRCVKGF